jgi:tetratricopeptide (TPR) repeat protein
MRYAAFLSYSHADARWAQWLHRRLETYRVPARLVGTQGPYGPIGARLGTVFRDRDELPTSGDLGTTIRAALADSDALILICSPAAAQSRWVHGEVEAFKALGRADRIACFIVGGEPGATDMEAACFPAALTAVGPDGAAREPLAADARPEGDGRDRAFLRLVAGLLGVSYDVLARREIQRRHRRMWMVTAASLAGMTIALGLAATAYVARNDAQRRQAQAEDILGFMLGDLRGKLTTVGRLDLMRAVDDKATHYFATLNPRDLSDRALEEQARSLTGIGQVRLDEGKYDQAMSAFREAYDRSSALVDRDPHNGQRLFDRAQAEYWVGAVNWNKGLLDDTQVWFTRYRDSAVRLAAMDRSNFAWQQEVAYGQDNLATLDQSRGRKRQAQAEYASELTLYRQWMRERPRDLQVRDSAANVVSFLGTLAQADGRLAEAESRFQEQVDMSRRNRLAEPDNVLWKTSWLNAQVLLANLQIARGHVAVARRNLDDAARVAAALAVQDPKNLPWQQFNALCQSIRARLAYADDPDLAGTLAKNADVVLRAAHLAQPEDERFLRSFTTNLLFRAYVALSAGAPAESLRLAREAHAALAPAWSKKQSEGLRLLLAEARLREGDAASVLGDVKTAHAAWAASEHLLRDGLGDPPAFNRLELLVRVLRAEHRDEEATRYRATLDVAGFVPLVAFSAQPPRVRVTTAAR